ncbi:Chaperone protein3, chloroplastic [Frankliniella fusca]|uniref:Chaperone protein3, chloroplastic n=1 Tax=Frankliniella fusca TaxID=407009 RepID=A0AAE1HF16_9NEOP|nr:Chaperone protein3, chloroplastic [Frankliniella fusca]
MFERGMRGGVASINKRHVTANNPYIGETYCSDKPTSYVMYYDANSLYSTALCKKLPVGGFRYLSQREIDEFDPRKISAESDTGYLFEVDLDYPSDLHDAHNDYPLAPEHVEPAYRKLSKLQKKLIRDFGLSEKSTKKLIPNLSNKQNYVLQGEILVLYLDPLFHSFDIFNNDLVCVERKKSRVVLNRPVYVGQACLDISKQIMYEFYYKVLKQKYGSNISVCGTDTDSLIVEIFTEDIYEDMYEMREHFDTSDYPKTHPLFSLSNKKVMGKFKDEMNSVPIVAFVGLRAKMYSFKTMSNGEKSVGKGIPRGALKTQLCFEDYLNCITKFERKNVNFSKISTDRKHNVMTTYSVKKGLSCFDDKRFILDDNVTTLAHGHCNIKNMIEDSDTEKDCDGDCEMLDEGEENLRGLIELMDLV